MSLDSGLVMHKSWTGTDWMVLIQCVVVAIDAGRRCHSLNSSRIYL